MNRHHYLSRLTTADIPRLAQLEEKTRLSFWGEENYRRFLEDFPEYFGCKLVILRDEGQWELAGFLLARALFEDLEILKIGVFPEHQRVGLGSQLLGAALAEGLRRGCRRCFLEVRESNAPAIGFYHRHGFRSCAKRLGYYSNPVEHALVMERDL